MAKLVFDPDGYCEHAVDIQEEGVPFPKGSTSRQEFRYILIDGKAVDRFAGLDDKQAIVAFDKLVQERNAAAQKAEEESVRSENARLSRLEYLRRFSVKERIAVNQSADPIVQDFMVMLNAAEFVSIIDDDTIAGTSYLETLGLLGKGRAAEILKV